MLDKETKANYNYCMSKDYKFEDNSSDRKYFTIIPNYVLNHSSAIDKAIYIDIKRSAGENGKCFMTEETMCKRNGIGEKKLHKSLKYLLEHKWIEFVGMTSGKTRPIKTYKVNDIWKRNVDFYNKEKIPSESGVFKDTRQKEEDTLQKTDKIPFERGGIRRSNIKKINKKKYVSINDINEQEIKLVANQYEVPISLVKGSLEDLINYCQAHGRRYKNYLAALRNFVKKDSGKNGIVKKAKPEFSEMPELTKDELSKNRSKLKKIKETLSNHFSL